VFFSRWLLRVLPRPVVNQNKGACPLSSPPRVVNQNKGACPLSSPALAASDFTLGLQTGVTVNGGAPQTVGNVTGVNLSVSNPSGDGMTWVVTFSGAGIEGGSLANGVYDITVNTGSITSQASPAQTAQARGIDVFARMFGNATGQTTVDGVTTPTVNGTALTLLENEFDASPSQTAYKEAYFDELGGGTEQINGTDLTLVENNFNNATRRS
jgi:hypothetical protein